MINGVTGIGVKQKCPADKRFIHSENLGNDYIKMNGGPRP